MMRATGGPRLVLLLSLLAGCAGKPAVAPRASQRAPSNAPLPDRDWGDVVSARFFVSLPLPDARAWHVDDRSGRWLVASHPPSESMLWVRAWREGSVVTHHECEAEARRLRPDLLGPDETALVDRRPLRAPPGFDTEVGFAVHRARGALGGVAVAVGANIRKCLVLAYATRAEGEGAPDAVAGRLAFIAERVFARATNRTIDDRVVPAVTPGSAP